MFCENEQQLTNTRQQGIEAGNTCCFSPVHALQDLMSCQTQLMEASQLRQRLEETLRQRERELTALKGALKEEVANHDKEIETLREQYSKDMEKLRGSMEQVSQVCGSWSTLMSWH